MATIKISALTEKSTMSGTEEVLINDSGASKKFSTQRFLDVKDDCNTYATNASASAVAAAASAASAEAVFDSFDDRYLGDKTADPTTDNDGNALAEGMLYFNTTSNNMMVYDGSAWITTSSATLATLDVYKFTATSNQTVFTGSDDASNTLAIKPTAEIVVMNGAVLEPTADYSVTQTTLTLTSGAATNDEVNVYAFGNFELADHYSKVASDARFLGLAGGTMTGAITTNSTFDGRDVATDGSKLDGIEASADVTDTTNVTAAGALMDSEVTNLAAVKAFDTTDYATAAQGTTADAALPKTGGALTGAVTTTSTFDGVDIATRDAVLTSTTTTAGAALPKAGGTMTGTTVLKGITETQLTKSGSFTPVFADGTVYSCTGTMTITMPTATAGKSFTIMHATATSITWAGTIKWNKGAAPTADSGIDIYTFISDGTNWYGMQAGTAFA